MESTGLGDIGEDQLPRSCLAITAVGGGQLQKGVPGSLLRDGGDAEVKDEHMHSLIPGPVALTQVQGAHAGSLGLLLG